MRDVTMFFSTAPAQDGARANNDISTSDTGIFVVDQAGSIRFCNDLLLAWLGFSLKQVTRQTITAFLPGLHLPARSVNAVTAFKRPKVKRENPLKLLLHKADGNQIAVTVSLDLLVLNGEKLLLGTIHCDQGRYARKRSMEDLMYSVMLSKQAMAITDKNGRFEFVNDAFESMTGYCLDEMVGRCWDDVLPDLKPTSFTPARSSVNADTNNQKRISSHRKKDGTIFMLCQSMRFFIDADGESTHHIFEGRDISATVAAYQRLNHLAHYDALTNLPARTRVLDCLQQTLDEAHRNKRRFAIAIIDVDNFKRINDGLGHSAGDMVLQEVGARIKNSLGDDDMVGRLSGDEFIMILPKSENAESVINGIHAAFSVPFSIKDTHFSVGVSIGAAIYPIHGDDQQSLLEHADAQMYLDKPADDIDRQSGRRAREASEPVDNVSRVNPGKKKKLN